MSHQSLHFQDNTYQDCVINTTQKSIFNASKIELTINLINNSNCIHQTPISIKPGTHDIHLSLLHYTSDGNVSLVKNMLDLGAVVNIRDENCLTPLHLSIVKNQKDIFDLLLSYKAEIGAISRRDICPIYTAAEYNRREILEKILTIDKNQIWKRDGYESLPIHIAAYNGHTDCLKVLIEGVGASGINAKNLFGLTPLYCAVQNNQHLAVYLLLREGANPNIEKEFGFRPLHSTAVTGNVTIAEELIKEGAEIDPVSISKETPLFVACCTGENEIVKLLLSNNADKNMIGPGGNTPLHGACMGNHIEVVKTLLSGGIGINSKNDKQETPLHIAIYNGSVDICKLLISYNCHVNAEGPEGDSPLHIAIKSSQIEIIRLLMKSGARTEIKNSKGETPIKLAGHNKEISQLLLKNFSKTECEKLYKSVDNLDYNHFEQILKPGFNLNTVRPTLLHLALEKRNCKIVQRMIDYGIDLKTKNCEGIIPLLLACRNGDFWLQNDNKENLQIVKLLINSTHDINSRDENGDTALHYAIKNKNLEIIEYLIASKIDLNIRGQHEHTPLTLACKLNHWKIQNLLMGNNQVNVNDQSGKYFEEEQWAPIHFAANNNNVELINLLYDKGAELNIPDKHGYTPLHITCDTDKFNATKTLISLGANVNQEDNAGWQPIHLAAWNGLVTIVELLIKNGAKINGKTNHGDCPLHLAARKGRVEVVNLLVKNGTNINIRNDDNQTALHMATEWGRAGVVEILLNKDADVQVKTKGDKTPLDLIERNNKKMRSIYKKFKYL